MISNKFIVDKASQIISGGGLTEQQISQMYSVDTLSERSVLSVANLAALPNVVSNLGSLVYVVAENKYYYSDGVTWNINYSSEYTIISSVAYAWGFGRDGQLGDGTTTLSRPSPVTVLGGITNWSRVSAGGSHNLALTTTGIAYAWGSGGEHLGDGTLTSRLSPVTVIGGLTWSQLDAGSSHSLGLTSTGIAYAWGGNGSGQLGTGNTTSTSSPVTVVGGITNWSQLAAGSSHSLGITSTGIAYAWGANNSGQIGDGTTVSKLSPVTVVGGITNWSQLVAGNSHTVGLTSTGIAYAWGRNLEGQLGNGYSGVGTSRLSPVTVVGGITNWSQVSIGKNAVSTLGLTSTGIAYGWGYNGQGRLGDGTTTQRSIPVTVVGGITNWTQLSAGDNFALGLTSAGIAYAWGRGNEGQLGNGTLTSRLSPVTVVGGITNWSQVSAGGNHSLCLTLASKGF